MAYTSRVGLGSPAIDFSPKWAAAFRQSHESPSTQQPPAPTAPPRDRASSSSSPGKTGMVLDRVSGLPSPPGTNSDIALPTPDLDITGVPSLMNEVSAAAWHLCTLRQYN